MEHLPRYIALLFAFTSLLTLGIFYKASHYSRTTLIVLLVWMALQFIIGRSGFYTVTNSFPPRFVLMVFPPLLVIVALFVSKKGRAYVDALDIKSLTLLHTVRIFVELVLYLLCVHKVVPQLMTFEGRNFDILSGLSAPVIYYFAFVRKSLGKRTLVIWNLVCVALLLTIVFNAVFSAPFPFQKFALEQPNIAVLYAPFNWLPAFVVPLALLSHLAAFKQLLSRSTS